eukprot:TRINITY_DN4585_c2_g2_i1.p1 TRINITY_DN4585_c2_g2~~TRINITY_DN4585_c2_g2_i1.p1  ORF type:complete len:821 (+),score=276.57 TRINITY_DN4585_c2_g2_i1:76-2538(+)
MCSAQELADLRQELSALVGDCEMLGTALQGGYEKLGKTVRGLGNRLASLDDTSTFGFDTRSDLSITRWEVPRPACWEDVNAASLPPHIRPLWEAMLDAAALCREAREMSDPGGGYYIDTDYTGHELECAQDLPAIAIGIQETQANSQATARRNEELERLQHNRVGDALSRLFIWRRPNQVYPAYGIFPQGNKLLEDWPSCIPQNPDLLPHLELFQQGCFSDGWFVLAVSSIATHRELFQRLFVSCDFTDYGMYAFQFCDVTAGEDPTVPTAAEAQRNGRNVGTLTKPWRSVVIDSHIPMQLVEGDALVPTFGRTAEETALWLVYIMKAYAKWRGSYSYLHCGDTARACAELTGGRAKTERWNSDRITPESVCVMWWKLMLCSRLGILAMCAVLPNRVESGNIESNPEEELGETLWGDGEQIILAAELPASQTTEHLGARLDSGLKLIKLRNLRGRPTAGNGGQWDWGPSSAKWKDKRVRQYFSYTRMHECVAWIGITDFVKNYNTLLTVSGWEGAPYVSFSTLEACPPGQAPCHAHQYLLTLELESADMAAMLADDALLAVAANAQLYEPPDFRDLDRDETEQDEVTSPGLPRRDQEEKGCRVTVFLSQPNMQAMDGKAIVRRPVSLHVFRLQQRRLQVPEQRGADLAEDDDGEDGDPDSPGQHTERQASAEEEGAERKAVEFFWPRYNVVETQPVPVKDPCGSLERSKEYELLEQSCSFVITQPGLYSVAVEQENTRDEIEYCLHVTTEEVSEVNHSGLSWRCEFGGTHSDPLVRPDPRDRGGFMSQGSFTVSRSRGPSIGISDSMTEVSPRTRGSQAV